MKRIILSLIVAFIRALVVAANVATVAVDASLKDGMVVSAPVTLVYSPIDSRSVSLEINGSEVFSATEVGTYVWTPERPGTYVLTHIADTNVFMRKVVYFGSEDAKELELGWLDGPVSNLFPNIYASVTNVVIAPTVAAMAEGTFAGFVSLDAGVVIRDGCVLCVNGACPEDVVLPEGTRLVADGAFRNRNALMRMTIPASVTSIGSGAFEGCQGLTEVNFQGGPPDGFDLAGLSKSVIIRYNVEHQEAWLEAFAEFGFENVVSYRPFTPVISPASCTTFGGSDTLTVLISLNEDAEIHYTLDGSDPTAESPRYTKKFRIGQKTTVKAIAVFEGGWCGPIATAVYAKDVCADPVISPMDGTVFYSSDQKVSIICPDVKGVVHYTVDGSEPTESSPVYEGEFVIADTTTVKARVLSNEYLDSQIVSANLTREWRTVETPVISSDTTFVGATHDVNITCSTPQSTIYYTTDGTTPTHTSPVYAGSFAITTSCVIKAVAVCDDWKDSTVAEKSVERKWLPVSVPVVSAVSSFVGSRTPVQITCQTDGVSIYYTLDGNSPDTSSFLYDGVFYISNSCTIRAIAIRSDEIYHGVAEARFSIEKEWTRGDSLNAPDLCFDSTGNQVWVRDVVVSHDGVESLRSGKIGDDQRSEISTTVEGVGTLSFWLKVSCEDSGGYYDYDRLEFHVDDSVACFDGERGWTNVVVKIDSDGMHTLRWIYIKDEGELGGQDCVWLDQIVWTPSAAPVDPIPDIGYTPSAADVTAAVADAADTKVSANIDETNYNDFRKWAGKVKATGGSAAGAQGVMDAQNAWMSYALGQDTLLDTAPTDEDISVETFTPSTESGKFDFTVSVKDIKVGSEAAKENLKKVFGLEGAATLEGAAFSSDKVDIEFDTPVDGKVKFTAGPKDTNAKAFFMKVKLNP